MNKFNIRKSTNKDLDKIMQLIEYAQQFFYDANINQWQNGYPNTEVILQDIAAGESYVVCDKYDTIVATAMISFAGEATYAEIDGKWISNNDAKYAVVHRIAVHPSNKGQGIAAFILHKVMEMLTQHNATSLRIDTHRENAAMQSVINRMQFEYCGIIYVDDRQERLAYEKLATSIC